MKKKKRKKRKVLKFRRIFVIGNMSSGKSTFLNSLLKENILPSSNLACTSKKIILNINNKLRDSYVFLKEEKINLNLNKELVKILNSNDEKEDIILKAPSNYSKLQNTIFYDTPGINNSMDIGHSIITKENLENLKKEDKVILIMNAENLFSTDDQRLVSYLLSKGIGKNKKLIVVINKIDAILLSEENTISEILKNTKKFLELNEIDNYDVYVYSAIYYKLKRDEKNLDKKEKRRLEELKQRGISQNLTLEQIIESIEKRDKTDKNKTVGALKRTENQKYIDTTNRNIEDVITEILEEVERIRKC